MKPAYWHRAGDASNAVLTAAGNNSRRPTKSLPNSDLNYSNSRLDISALLAW